LADHPLPPAVLAIDGGNSKTDVALVAGDGTLLASARGPGINAHETGVDQTAVILDAVVKQAAAQVDASRSGWVALHTVACLANADLPEEEEEHAAAVQALGWSPEVTVVNDTFAILRAGLADEVRPHWGVGVVCGAGINCVGVAPDGRVTRFLALGTISGDWGGGYGLGAEVLWHAIRAEDGRGRDTLLTGYVTSHFDVDRVEDVTLGIHKGKIDDDDLTDLAPVLLRAASAGDQVAVTVVNRLADEISVMAITAMCRLGLTDLATPVVLGGGVMTARNPLLMSGISRQLAEAAPAAKVSVIDVPPVAGAALLGLDHVQAPAAAKSRLRAAYDVPRS
jgi:N-acetylglucosamine kinase-like BadF-type ATPase